MAACSETRHSTQMQPPAAPLATGSAWKGTQATSMQSSKRLGLQSAVGSARNKQRQEAACEVEPMRRVHKAADGMEHGGKNTTPRRKCTPGENKIRSCRKQTQGIHGPEWRGIGSRTRVRGKVRQPKSCQGEKGPVSCGDNSPKNCGE